MAEKGIDAYRVVSVLGYCLLPMVGVGALSVMVTLEYVSIASNLNPSDVSPQWYGGLPALNLVSPLVHMVSFEHIRCRSPYVRAETACRVPGWTSLRMFCATQCLQRRIECREVGCLRKYIYRFPAMLAEDFDKPRTLLEHR